jgi:regulator of RNase E activity RraA
VDELAEIGIPIFASGVTAEGTVKVTPGGINCPINCGGLAISAGDIIIGDNNGVVVVAYGRIAEVLETSSGIKQKEKIIREKVLNGESLYDIFGLEKILGLHPVKFL